MHDPRGFSGTSRFRVCDLIGVGTMGLVYRARHRSSENTVAIKLLPFHRAGDPGAVRRFYSEMKGLGKFDHPNIVKAIDAGGGNAFFQYQVPSAVITLKQGFGRLIRSLHDRGLLVLLDNRILKKQYGRVFIDSLPNYKRTTDIRAVEQFFGVGG